MPPMLRIRLVSKKIPTLCLGISVNTISVFLIRTLSIKLTCHLCRDHRIAIALVIKNLTYYKKGILADSLPICCTPFRIIKVLFDEGFLIPFIICVNKFYSF